MITVAKDCFVQKLCQTLPLASWHDYLNCLYSRLYGKENVGGGFSLERHPLLHLVLSVLPSICMNSRLDTSYLCRLHSFATDLRWYTGGTGVKFSPITAENQGLIPGSGAFGWLPMSTTAVFAGGKPVRVLVLVTSLALSSA